MNKIKKCVWKIGMIASIGFLIFVSTYTSMIVGTLAHELSHAKYSTKLSAIVINFNGEGYTLGQIQKHDFNIASINGMMVEILLYAATFVSIFILIIYNKECKIKNSGGENEKERQTRTVIL